MQERKIARTGDASALPSDALLPSFDLNCANRAPAISVLRRTVKEACKMSKDLECGLIDGQAGEAEITLWGMGQYVGPKRCRVAKNK